MDDVKKAIVTRELTSLYGEQAVAIKALPDGKVLFKIVDVPLPLGCTPENTDVLLVYENGVDMPQVLVRQGIHLKSGESPRSTNPMSVDGEPWMSFSANFPFDLTKPVTHFVIGKLGRFAQPS
jgi:hypothetical protein